MKYFIQNQGLRIDVKLLGSKFLQFLIEILKVWNMMEPTGVLSHKWYKSNGAAWYFLRIKIMTLGNSNLTQIEWLKTICKTEISNMTYDREQFTSSDKSLQSLSPSQSFMTKNMKKLVKVLSRFQLCKKLTHSMGMQSPLLHSNWSSLQLALAPGKENGLKIIELL